MSSRPAMWSATHFFMTARLSRRRQMGVSVGLLSWFGMLTLAQKHAARAAMVKVEKSEPSLWTAGELF